MLIKDLIPLYLKYLHTLGRSEHTLIGTKYRLKKFLSFLEDERVYDLEDLTHDVLLDYQQDLAFYLTSTGKLLALESQAKLLSSVKGFTRFLKEKEYLLHDPGEKIALPKKAKRLPKVILTVDEMKKLLHAPDMRTNTGYRNRVILEVLYDTAIRRSELCHIKLSDMDLQSGFVLVRGKGDRDRVVPLSEKVCERINNYILSVRPSFLGEKDEGFLILNRFGNRMNPMGIWAVVKRCANLARLKKNVHPHTLRHTCATHMLRNGAPVRYVQEMLGHASLESTQVYTHVTINDLKEIHAKYHPAESITE